MVLLPLLAACREAPTPTPAATLPPAPTVAPTADGGSSTPPVVFVPIAPGEGSGQTPADEAAYP
ncbi:MAG: hypothetical protein KA170_07990, partial [Candidatus Promineofilum sp.]|nr:hypothetical protein [Promineifilum sp.]